MLVYQREKGSQRGRNLDNASGVRSGSADWGHPYAPLHPPGQNMTATYPLAVLMWHTRRRQKPLNFRMLSVVASDCNHLSVFSAENLHRFMT